MANSFCQVSQAMLSSLSWLNPNYAQDTPKLFTHSFSDFQFPRLFTTSSLQNIQLASTKKIVLAVIETENVGCYKDMFVY